MGPATAVTGNGGRQYKGRGPSATPARLAPIVPRFRDVRLLLPVLVFLGMDLALSLPSDAGLYKEWAEQALRSPLFHALPKEYPAASVAIYLAPLVLPFSYKLAFSLLAAAATVVLVLSGDGLPSCPGWPRRAGLYLLLGTVGVLFSRYDIFPALLAFWAVEAGRRDRWGRAWAWAVVGGLVKVFPFLLLPGFFLVEKCRTGRWPWARAAAACVPLALVAAAQSALSPGSLTSPVTYELRRGFQLGSTAGSLTLLADPLHVRWVYAFKSWEIVGSFHSPISVLLNVAMVGGLCAVWALTAKGRLSVEASSLAVLTVAVLTDKALSPQYIIWLVPLWAYWPWRRGWLTASVLSTLVYPVFFLEAAFVGPGYYWATGAAVARNAILLGATGRWLKRQLAEGDVVPGAPGLAVAAPRTQIRWGRGARL